MIVNTSKTIWIFFLLFCIGKRSVALEQRNISSYFGKTLLAANALMNVNWDSNSSRVESSWALIRDELKPLLKQLTLEDYANLAEEILSANVGSFRKDNRYGMSRQCINNTEELLIGIMEQKKWALTMVDAIGKPPSGLADFNLQWLGAYDECIAVEAVVDNVVQYKGRYCSATFNIPTAGSSVAGFPVELIIGLCVPSSCNEDDVKTLLETGLYALPVNTSGISEPQITCQLEVIPFGTKEIAVMTVCAVFAVVILMGTFYDLVVIQTRMLTKRKLKVEETQSNGTTTKLDIEEKQETVTSDATPTNGFVKQDKEVSQDSVEVSNPGLFWKILLSFSIYSNGRKLLNTNQPSGSLTAVHGIRFLSMSWVILGHSFMTALQYGEGLLPFTLKVLKRFESQAIFNGTVSVDSFFLLSGVLVSYLSMKMMKKSNGAKRFGWGMFYFHRFWRLTPPYMLFLMVYVPLVKYWGDGPRWQQGGFELNECEDTWWRNLLYINNLYEPTKNCMGWSWYLANDMQFFVISPLMLIPLYHKPVFGGIVCLALTVGCVILRAVTSLHFEFPANLLLVPQDRLINVYDLYFKPWSRIGPYVVGIFTGWLLYRTDCKVRLYKMVNLSCWAAAAAIAMAVVYGLWKPGANNAVNNVSIDEATLYNAVSRTAWGVAVAWVIFACATGNGGYVNSLLSWSPFVVLGRLSYCAYLVHPVIMDVFHSLSRTPLHLNEIEVVYQYFGHMVTSYMAAFCLSLAFESPMMRLEKVFLGRGKSS